MDKIFEYDVFLSFTSSDAVIARQVWKTLSDSGLRVFWSDENLKKNVGESFFTAIEAALTQSKYFVLLCTKDSMNSNWVREEYEIFFSQIYIPSNRKRKLLILESTDCSGKLIPTLLKNIQTTSSLSTLTLSLGGIDIEKIKNENMVLKKDNLELSRSISDLKRKNSQLTVSLKNSEEKSLIKDHMIAELQQYSTDTKNNKIEDENLDPIIALNTMINNKIVAYECNHCRFPVPNVETSDIGCMNAVLLVFVCTVCGYYFFDLVGLFVAFTLSFIVISLLDENSGLFLQKVYCPRCQSQLQKPLKKIKIEN